MGWGVGCVEVLFFKFGKQSKILPSAAFMTETILRKGLQVREGNNSATP